MSAILKKTVLIALLLQQAPWSWAQVLKKVIEQDYKKWHTLSVVNITTDGLWSSYKVEYENETDTMFIHSNKSGSRTAFPHATQITFSPDAKSAVIHFQDNSINLRNLNSKRSILINNPEKYNYAPRGDLLAILNAGKLDIYDSSLKLTKEIASVLDFKIAANSNLSITTTTGVVIYNVANKYLTNVTYSLDPIMRKNLTWNKSGTVLAFLEKSSSVDNFGSDKIVHYDLKTKRINKIENTALSGNKISDYIQTPITLSDDGDKLFFYYSSPPRAVVHDSLVEIWESSSKLIYPAERIYGDPALKPKLAVWAIKENAIKILSTDDLPNSLLTANRKHVLTYSYLTNEPQFEVIAPVDIYITNIATAEKKLLLNNHNFSTFSVGCSPSGRYIHYFKNKNWWIYDCAEGNHRNLTSKLKASFDDDQHDEPAKFEGYTSPGWTSDSKYLILYDKYDIWLISPNLKTQRRITNGSEKKIKFRIADHIYRASDIVNSADFILQDIELTNGLLISAKSEDHSTGFFKWHPSGKLEQIDYGKYKMSGLRKSTSGKDLIYIKENFGTPPSINYYAANSGKPKLLLQSNLHAKEYEWGTSAIVQYKNATGQELQGAVFYPAGFQKGKLYPMVVYIYSKVSHAVHDYNNPSMYNPIGFTPSNFTSNGYLVFMPDIHYKVGNPGKSILDCVTAGVTHLLGLGIVDPKKIGLLGHSYGGYETCLLLTQTNLFAAAVAGAAVTDIISGYLSMNPNTGVKMDWRFETQQYRMASTPFDNQKGYLENSPVINAEKISTPLLSWAGKHDSQCDWRQSLELHLALRRLHKKNTFLAYPNQGHILQEPLAQYDLTTRINDWFEQHLKNTPSKND